MSLAQASDRRFQKHGKWSIGGPKSPHKNHPALTEGRTIFKNRVAEPGSNVKRRLLVSGANNRKIGAKVRVGRWAGFPIFTLTLEERATCPSTCHHWRTCYGNNMQWPLRWAHGQTLLNELHRELTALQTEHPGGFVVRLHVLGDFYSTGYVDFWADALRRFPALHVFGYTAWPADTLIGAAVFRLANSQWERFAVRQSVMEPRRGRREAVSAWNDTLAIDPQGAPARLAPPPTKGNPVDGLTWAGCLKGFVCPAQQRDDKYCGVCGACWESDHNVVFLIHGRE